MQPLNLAQHTWSTAVFSVAVATLVPVLITLCFAARAFVVVCTVAARPRCIDCTVCAGCGVALRDVTARVAVVVMLLLSVCGAREIRAGAVTERAIVPSRVAPNAADVHAKITNAKDNRFKRNPFYCSPYFIIKKWLVQVGSVSGGGDKKRPRGADVYRGHHMIYSSRIGQLFMSKYCLAFCALGRHSFILD